MEKLNSLSCCGVDELDGLEDKPEETLLYVCKDKYVEEEYSWDTPFKQAFILITDPVKYGRGKELVAYIKKHKLGTVVGTKPKKNPNSGNMLQAWLWSPDERELKKWFKLNNKK